MCSFLSSLSMRLARKIPKIWAVHFEADSLAVYIDFWVLNFVDCCRYHYSTAAKLEGCKTVVAWRTIFADHSTHVMGLHCHWDESIVEQTVGVSSPCHIH